MYWQNRYINIYDSKKNYNIDFEPIEKDNFRDLIYDIKRGRLDGIK